MSGSYGARIPNIAVGHVAASEGDLTLCGRDGGLLMPLTDSAGHLLHVELQTFLEGEIVKVVVCQECAEHPDYPLLLLGDI